MIRIIMISSFFKYNMAYNLYINFSIQEFITECVKTKQIKKMYLMGLSQYSILT